MVESSLTLWCFIRGYGTFIHDILPHHPEERAITLTLEGELFLESRAKPKGRFSSAVKTVAADLGNVAARIRGQVDEFFGKLHAA